MRKRTYKRYAAIIALVLLPVLAALLPVSRVYSGQAVLVDIRDIDPTVLVHAAYSTSDNFTSERLYDSNYCLLRPQVAQAVAAANREFRAMGYRIKAFDCYRPRHISLRMWAIGERHNAYCHSLGKRCKKNNCETRQADCAWEPLSDYLSKRSKHNLGAAVDMTLTHFLYDIDMGTEFDSFELAAHTSNAAGPALQNRMLMKQVMNRNGFTNYVYEWWHYEHQTHTSYEPLDVTFSQVPGVR